MIVAKARRCRSVQAFRFLLIDSNLVCVITGNLAFTCTVHPLLVEFGKNAKRETAHRLAVP